MVASNKKLAEEWELFLTFASFSGLMKSNFKRLAFQTQPKMLLLFLS